MNIDQISSILHAQASLSQQVISNKATENAAHPKNHQTPTPVSIIFTVINSEQSTRHQSSHSQHNSNSNDISRYLIEIQPQHLIQNKKITSIQSSSIMFASQYPMVAGELLLALGQPSGHQFSKNQSSHIQGFNINPASLTHINQDIQLTLHTIHTVTLQAQHPSQILATQTEGHFFKPLMRAIQTLANTHPKETELQKLATMTSIQAQTLPPLDWLSTQDYSSNAAHSIPKWVKQIPFMALKNLQQQNLRILEDYLKSTHHFKAISQGVSLDQQSSSLKIHKAVYSSSLKTQMPFRASKAYNLHNRQATSTQTPQASLENETLNIQKKVSHWLQLQKRWLEMPHSLLVHPMSSFSLLNLSEGSALLALHHQLNHLWPEYKQAEEALLRIQYTVQDQLIKTSRDFIRAGQKKDFVSQFIDLFQNAKTHEHQTSLLKALTLRTGLAELIQAQQGNNQETHSQDTKSLQFSLPYASHPDQTSWFQTSIHEQYSSESTQEDTHSNTTQWLDLNFESSVFGHIQFRLTFPLGFTDPLCEPSAWIEDPSILALFQQKETRLVHHLTRCGLSVEPFHWRAKKLQESTAMESKQPKFQIDDYI